MYTTTEIAALLEMGFDKTEILALAAAPSTAPAAVAVTPAKKAMPEGLKAAKAHCYEARIARRTAPKNAKNSKGMTSQERRDLAKTLPAGYTKAQWTKAVAEFKAAN